MQEKKCTKCGEVKSVEEFYKHKNKKDGVMPSCKDCTNKHISIYRDSFIGRYYSIEEKKCPKCKIVKPSKDFCKDKKYKNGLSCWCRQCSKLSQRIWYKNNSKNMIESAAKWATQNPDKRRNIRINWEKNNPEKIILSRTKIRKTPDGKLNHSISNSIRQCLINGKSGYHWETLVGYTVDQLKEHLEKQFAEGMGWDNYGKNGWEIDHKIPLSVHNFETYNDLDFKKAWALKNLQPLWLVDNRSKGAKICKPFQPSLTI